MSWPAQKKIFITGTGRCGTTFLVRLFTLAGFYTGFKEEIIFGTEASFNPGLEHPWYALQAPISCPAVLKSPSYMENVVNVLNHPPPWAHPYVPAAATGGRKWIESFIVPVRDFGEAAASRWRRRPPSPQITFDTRHATPTPEAARAIRVPAAAGMPGGPWKGNTVAEEEAAYIHMFEIFQQQMVFYDLPVIYLDFHKMTTDKTYLYDELKHIMESHNVTQEQFFKAYDDATSLWVKGEF